MGTVVSLFQMKEMSLVGEIQNTCSWHLSQKPHRSVDLRACFYIFQLYTELKITCFSLFWVLLTADTNTASRLLLPKLTKPTWHVCLALGGSMFPCFDRQRLVSPLPSLLVQEPYVLLPPSHGLCTKLRPSSSTLANFRTGVSFLAD